MKWHLLCRSKWFDGKWEKMTDPLHIFYTRQAARIFIKTNGDHNNFYFRPEKV